MSAEKSKKSESAYRTISEVAETLEVPQHVLRFWESKFKQLEPLKRGGGRRYYRPEDVDLLKKIHFLLYTKGYTIKGVQKLLSQKSRELTSELIGISEHFQLQTEQSPEEIIQAQQSANIEPQSSETQASQATKQPVQQQASFFQDDSPQAAFDLSPGMKAEIKTTLVALAKELRDLRAAIDKL